MSSRRLFRTLPAVMAGFLVVGLLGFAPVLAVAAPAPAAVANSDAAARALAWLRGQQQPDGSFSAFGGPGDPGTSADIALAFAAAGIDPETVRSAGGIDLESYLVYSAARVSGDAGLSGKVALALYASGVYARDAAGAELVAGIAAGYNPDSGLYGQSFYGSALAVLALDTFGEPIELGAVEALYTRHTPEGSWGFTGDTTPGTGDSNTTAIVIQTLVAIDGERNLVQEGLAYLRTLQDDTGALAYDNNFPPLTGDANSTALAVQAFVAAGEDPATLPKGDLLEALAAFENPSGAFKYQPAFPDDSLLATGQAVPALLLSALPIAPVANDDQLADAAQPAAPVPGCDFHEPTQHNVCGAFATYWQSHGGLEVFGYALTEEVDFQGQRVQYFERARFEWHPENAGTGWEVLLTRFGADDVARLFPQGVEPAVAQPGCTYFEATQHNLCGAFATIWEQKGGLANFGYPLTEPFEEDGMTVQYFERVRFELQPGGWPDRLDVFFGRIGAEALDRELAR